MLRQRSQENTVLTSRSENQNSSDIIYYIYQSYSSYNNNNVITRISQVNFKKKFGKKKKKEFDPFGDKKKEKQALAKRNFSIWRSQKTFKEILILNYNENVKHISLNFKKKYQSLDPLEIKKHVDFFIRRLSISQGKRINYLWRYELNENLKTLHVHLFTDYIEKYQNEFQEEWKKFGGLHITRPSLDDSYNIGDTPLDIVKLASYSIKGFQENFDLLSQGRLYYSSYSWNNITRERIEISQEENNVIMKNLENQNHIDYVIRILNQKNKNSSCYSITRKENKGLWASSISFYTPYQERRFLIQELADCIVSKKPSFFGKNNKYMIKTITKKLLKENEIQKEKTLENLKKHLKNEFVYESPSIHNLYVEKGFKGKRYFVFNNKKKDFQELRSKKRTLRDKKKTINDYNDFLRFKTALERENSRIKNNPKSITKDDLEKNLENNRLLSSFDTKDIINDYFDLLASNRNT